MNNHLKGIAWVMVYCVTFTSSMSLNKVIDPGVPTPLKILIRAVFGLLFFSPLILKDGWTIFKTNNLKLHLIRILFMSMAMGGTYYTYSNLPFTIATSIGFTGPIFTAVLAYFILKDRLSFGQWMAVLAGYMGVLIFLNPEGEIDNTLYVAIFANIVTGLNLIYAKKLTRLDSRNTIVVMGNIGVIVMSALWTGFYWLTTVYGNSLASIIWHTPSLYDTFLMLCMGCLGSLSQISYITALKYSTPSILGPFEYTRLIIAIPIGLALGDTLPNLQESIGIFIIIGATLYLSWKGTTNDQ